MLIYQRFQPFCTDRFFELIAVIAEVIAVIAEVIAVIVEVIAVIAKVIVYKVST
jgi:hypothetical protein